MKLWQHLGIQPGITAIIGGGGKTTLLRVLGEELAQSHKVLLCTTTKILPFPGIPLAVTADELKQLGRHSLICAGEPIPASEKLGPPALPITELATRFDYVLVEADGAAGRPLKAHAPHEPVIPKETRQTICVVGASGFGQPIWEAAHRPERYARLAGVPASAPATAETEAAVLAAEHLQDIIFVNQAETFQEQEATSALAQLLRCPVVAGSLWRGVYWTC